MSSGGLLLLLGLLTLWAELTPVSSQNRPNFCYLRPDRGQCGWGIPHFFYNSAAKKCQIFIYHGCGGNANRFKTPEECRKTCVASAMRRPT